MQGLLEIFAHFLGLLDLLLNFLWNLILVLFALIDEEKKLLKIGSSCQLSLQRFNPFLCVLFFGVTETLHMVIDLLLHVLQRNTQRVMASIGVISQVIREQNIELGLDVIIIHPMQ